MGTWDLTVDDIHKATQRAKDAIAALEGKKRVRVTTPLGTDFTVSIEGRPALEVTPIKKRGQMMGPVPLWAEVAFAAVEDFTHGTAVVDGVMLGIGLQGQVKEPIHWTFEGGRCVKIEGGEEAERLRRAIEGVENVEVAGEFAFGTSEKAPFGSPSEKGRIGTVHIALGDNHNAYPGGQNVCCAPPGRRLPERDHVDRGRRHVHPQGRRVGTSVSIVNLVDVEPIELPLGSWSRMVAKGEQSSLGYSVFTPGTELTPVCHEAEEVAYVVSGSGELRLDDGAVFFPRG